MTDWATEKRLEDLEQWLVCLNDPVCLSFPGNPVRECQGEQIGEREGQRLFLIISPYTNWPYNHWRLGLVDENDNIYRMWYGDEAPKWAQRIYELLFSGQIDNVRNPPCRRKKHASN